MTRAVTSAREHIELSLGGIAIRELREKLGMTQLEFGYRVGISGKYTAQTVSRWEHGKRRPERYYAEKMRRMAANIEALRRKAESDDDDD